jgi:DNA modification methylase
MGRSQSKSKGRGKSVQGLKPHPLAELLPMMSDDDFKALKADIQEHGQRDPIECFEGRILDGRNRYRACVELGLAPVIREFKGDHSAALSLVYSRAVHRNMSESQKAAAAVKFLPHFEKAAISRKKQHKVEPVPPEEKGKARDFCGGLFGVSGRYVSDARWLFENDSKLFARVFEGELPISQAKRELQRTHKTMLLKEKTKDAIAKIQSIDEPFILTTNDAVKILASTAKSRPGCIPLIATDPPYNQGIEYGKGVNDSRSDDEFEAWLASWLCPAAEMLTDDGSIFVIISGRWQAAVENILQGCGLHRRNVIAWLDPFGNHTAGNFTDCWRPIIYYTAHATKFTWHGDRILIPSDRQKDYKDKRAIKDGKVPTNVWDEFPRLVDNSKERIPGFPTQIPVALMERIIRAASNPGDMVLDPFNGSGTTGEAAVRLHRRYTGCDIVPANIELTRGRLQRAMAETERKG